MATVALVASDIDARDAWRAELERHGHAVVAASTAASAVSRLRESPIEVLVLDHEVIGGIGVLVAALERTRDRPPLVLIGGAASAPALSARIGAAAFVPRTGATDELAAVVARLAPHAA
jgi:DNA-binding NtrC family response regulator